MGHFIKNWRTLSEDIGKALCIEMTWTQYSDGAPYPILSNTSQDLPYVKGRTILSVRKHLEECNGKLHLDTTYVQHPLRKNEVSIMHLVNNLEPRSNWMETNFQWKNLEASVGTPRQHENIIRKSKDVLYLGIINRSNLSTNDD